MKNKNQFNFILFSLLCSVFLSALDSTIVSSAIVSSPIHTPVLPSIDLRIVHEDVQAFLHRHQ